MTQPLIHPLIESIGHLTAPAYLCANPRLPLRCVEQLGDRGAERIDIADLSEEIRNGLTAPRPDICGLSLDRPRIMGILNVTPDSFSDGGDFATVKSAATRAKDMARDADILDIGGESTRPGAQEVPIKEEIARVIPVIKAIRDAGGTTPISVDTRKAEVAAAALAAGADMINDVSALGFDPDMAAVVAEADCPICLMHAQGQPETMQNNPHYTDVLGDVFTYLYGQIEYAKSQGIQAARIIADPGIGFGKTLGHNLSLLKYLTVFHGLNVPLLLGVSRKRFIGTLSGAEVAADRMAGSLSVALHGFARGVQIMRVHDTQETRQALDLYLALSEASDDA